MTTTVAIPPEVAKELKLIKVEGNYKSLGEVIEKMLVEYKKRRFLEASEKFRARMKKKGLKPADLIE